MRAVLQRLLRLAGKLIPAKYSSRRDRLSAEADQASTANQFRAGM